MKITRIDSKAFPAESRAYSVEEAGVLAGFVYSDRGAWRARRDGRVRGGFASRSEAASWLVSARQGDHLLAAVKAAQAAAEARGESFRAPVGDLDGNARAWVRAELRRESDA